MVTGTRLSDSVQTFPGSVSVVNWFTLRAGIRHDEFRLKIDPFAASYTRLAPYQPRRSPGGTGNAGHWCVWALGAAYSPVGLNRSL